MLSQEVLVWKGFTLILLFLEKLHHQDSACQGWWFVSITAAGTS